MISETLILKTKNDIQRHHSFVTSLLTSDSSYAEGKTKKAVKTAKLFFETLRSDTDSLLAQLVIITRMANHLPMTLMEWVNNLNDESLGLIRREAELIQPILDDGELSLEVF